MPVFTRTQNLSLWLVDKLSLLPLCHMSFINICPVCSRPQSAPAFCLPIWFFYFQKSCPVTPSADTDTDWALASGCLCACDEKLYHLSGSCRQEVKLQEKGLVSAVPSAVSGLTLLHALLLITFRMLHCSVLSIVSRREDKKVSRYRGHKIKSDIDVMHFAINGRKIMLDCTRKIQPPFTK